jgi:hypothetical protein
LKATLVGAPSKIDFSKINIALADWIQTLIDSFLGGKDHSQTRATIIAAKHPFTFPIPTGKAANVCLANSVQVF